MQCLEIFNFVYNIICDNVSVAVCDAMEVKRSLNVTL